MLRTKNTPYHLKHQKKTNDTKQLNCTLVYLQRNKCDTKFMKVNELMVFEIA